MKIVFEFISGARAGQVETIEARPVIRLGRHPDNDVAFDVQQDLDVSGHHAELRQESDGTYLYDVGSANGTFVGETRVTRLRLSSGHEVAFGAQGPRVRMRFERPADEHPVPAAPQGPPTAGASAAAKLDPDRQVGSRTVAMMIDAAMDQARQGRPSTMGRSTVFVRSLVNQAVRQSTRRFKVLVGVLVVLLVGAVVGFIVLRRHEQRAAQATQLDLRRQMAALMSRQTGAGTSAEKEELARKLELLNRKLAAVTPAASGREIVRKNRRAVYLMAISGPDGSKAKGFCSAFAIGGRVLATNAHCVLALEKHRKSGLSPFVVLNREPGRRHAITRAVRHPAYHRPTKTISEDVGLLQVADDLPERVELASDAELRDLEAGDVMYAFGFPGRLADVRSPNATLVQGVIGRVTRLDGTIGSLAQNKLIQHSAFTSGGTSGSPIFAANGKVFAVNAGGYVEPGTMQVMDPLTGRASSLRVAKQLAGYNFGIRIDVLRDLLRRTGLR
jgi:pSer/pThr/pTyr-binding forkhead associated (FHA) protein